MEPHLAQETRREILEEQESRQVHLLLSLSSGHCLSLAPTELQLKPYCQRFIASPYDFGSQSQMAGCCIDGTRGDLLSRIKKWGPAIKISGKQTTVDFVKLW